MLLQIAFRSTANRAVFSRSVPLQCGVRHAVRTRHVTVDCLFRFGFDVLSCCDMLVRHETGRNRRWGSATKRHAAWGHAAYNGDGIRTSVARFRSSGVSGRPRETWQAFGRKWCEVGRPSHNARRAGPARPTNSVGPGGRTALCPPRHNGELYPVAKRCFLPNKPTVFRAQLRVDVSVMLRLMNLEKASFRWVCFDYLPPFRIDCGVDNAHWTRFMGEAKPTDTAGLPHYVDWHDRQWVTSVGQPRQSRLAHGICVAGGTVSGV